MVEAEIQKKTHTVDADKKLVFPKLGQQTDLGRKSCVAQSQIPEDSAKVVEVLISVAGRTHG